MGSGDEASQPPRHPPPLLKHVPGIPAQPSICVPHGDVLSIVLGQFR